MKNRYDIVSKAYISNCFIEVIKAKIKNPKIKIYFCRPRIALNRRFQMFHFMWCDGKYSYDFSDLDDCRGHWYQDVLFKGYIRRFEKDFAEKYSKYRNGGDNRENHVATRITEK